MMSDCLHLHVFPSAAMYAGLVTEGIANIDHAMDDTLEHMMTDLGHGITATTRDLPRGWLR